jgi:tetraprenyl-beta-curcumene synthase
MTESLTMAAARAPAPTSLGRGGCEQPRAALPALGRRHAAGAGVALVLVNVRYWSSVAPQVRRELRGWRRRAAEIGDPVLRALAVGKLEVEGFNAEAAAMLATLAPRRHRRSAVAAMVALEVMYDYLDGLTESPVGETREDGERLFSAFTDAVTPSLERGSGDYYRYHPHTEDRYLDGLVDTTRRALATLPAADRVASLLQASARRGAGAQLQIHHASTHGAAVEAWAKLHAAGSALPWREFLAGAACSVLAVHALVAAASDPRTTYEQAHELDAIYLSISVLPTILDSLIDHKADVASGQLGYLQHYESPTELAERLAIVIEGAVGRSRAARHGPHHVMTLVGVVAYYTSSPAARDDFAQPVTAQLERQLRPLLTPTLAMMRGWRAAKSLRARRRGLQTKLRRGAR